MTTAVEQPARALYVVATAGGGEQAGAAGGFAVNAIQILTETEGLTKPESVL